MKIYDTVKKEEIEIGDYKDLIKIMQDGRQVDLYLKEKNRTRTAILHGM